MRISIIILPVFVLFFAAVGCVAYTSTTENSNLEPNNNQENNNKNKNDGDGEMENRITTIETNKGIIRFELFEDKVPATTENFIMLAESGFYNGLTFHRYEPSFVIQGGDPKGDGTGGSQKTIPLELHPDLKHVEGAVAMARKPDPNSATSQFYFTLAPAHFLDGNYAVFGQVKEGMDVVLDLRAGDRINTVSVN